MSQSTTPADKKKGFLTGYLSLSFIVFLIFSIGFLPVVLYVRAMLLFFTFTRLWEWLVLPFLIYIGFVVLLFSQLMISGLFIRLFHIRYEPGTFIYSFREKNAYKWSLVCSLYTPCRKLMEIFPVGGIKNRYYRLLGMNIGENTLVGGVIKDPCVTSFGKNTTMGEYAIIYGHIHNYEKGTITIKKVVIGDNCVIGAGAIIMPGVRIEDNVTVAAGAVVPQDHVLEKGRVYAGVPAKPI